MNLKTKQEKKKPWISPLKFLKISCVLKARLADPHWASLSTERCPHSCKGLTLCRSKAAGTLFMRRWKVSYSAEAWQRKPFASPWLSTYDFLLIERSQTHSGPFRGRLCSAEKDLLWKWECKCPHMTGAFFFSLDFSWRPANLIFWVFYFNHIHEHISLSV